MKKFFASLVMLLSLSAASVFAQSSLIATLSHEGEVSLYYGASALQQAHEAAAHGDVITLSSGTFTPVNITKAITLRGAGMFSDVENNVYSTVVGGNLYITIPETVTENLTIEGIDFSGNLTASGYKLYDATFQKCKFANFTAQDVQNLKIVHCYGVYKTTINSSSGFNSTVSIVNSYIASPQQYSGTSSVDFTNCVIQFRLPANGEGPGDLTAAVLKNSIIVKSWQSTTSKEYFSNNVTVQRCVAVNYDYNVWEKTAGGFAYPAASFQEVFKTAIGDMWTGSETYELTDEAKNKYLGLDGTEIGMHGGNFPFDSKTSAPQITKFNVATKSTVDGKLSVDIEVKGVE